MLAPEYIQSILERGGGMITCGDHLGIFVSPSENIRACPPGWCFVPMEIATPELINAAHEHMTSGNGRRSKWPKNQKQKVKNPDEMLDQVFDSQDYIG